MASKMLSPFSKHETTLLTASKLNDHVPIMDAHIVIHQTICTKNFGTIAIPEEN